ncbi:MAG TPA: hypothetical protein VIS73_10645 [Rhodocyclaceae bacterium]
MASWLARLGAPRGRAATCATAYALVATLPLLGIVNTPRTLYLVSEAAQYAVGNVAEWYGGPIFTAFFLLRAWLWRQTSFAANP